MRVADAVGEYPHDFQLGTLLMLTLHSRQSHGYVDTALVYEDCAQDLGIGTEYEVVLFLVGPKWQGRCG